MALNIRRYAVCDEPELQASWDRLSRTSPRASLFSTNEWCRAWLKTLGRTAATNVLVVKDERAEARGLLPVCTESQGPVRWLKFLGREGASGDHLDLLSAAADAPACWTALLDYWEQDNEHDGLILGELERESAPVHQLRDWANRCGYPWLEREQRVVPYADLPDSFDAYLKGLSGNMRYHVRRRRRALGKTSGARVVVLRSAADVDAALDHLFALHERRWQRAGRPGVFQSTAKRDFVRAFCAAACAEDWTRCFVLEVAGQRHGVLLAFHWSATANFYQMGWNPASPVESPGVLLLAASIEQAIREHQTRYDFLRGDEAYKRRWTRQYVDQTTLVIARTRRARLALAAECLKNRCKSVIQQGLGPAWWERVRETVGGAKR